MKCRSFAAADRRVLVVRLGCVVVAGLSVANCGGQPQTAGGSRVDSKYGVAASPRVIEPGQPIPKGGGRQMVGKTYVVAGRSYTPRENPNYTAVGTASWYGDAFHGRLTANGEIFDKESLAAAHPTLPLPSYVRVTNLGNTRSMVVRVNDRGPYHGERVIDVSKRVAEALDFKRDGTARVKVDYVGRASLRGSDDRKLVATLRADGLPANLPGGSTAPVMVAGAFPAARREAEPRPIVLAAAQAPAARMQPASSLAPFEREDRGEGGRPVSGIPLPPERPFDLVGAPPARPGAAPVRAGRPLVAASIYYAAPAAPGMRFSRADPMGGLKPQRFVAFRAAL